MTQETPNISTSHQPPGSAGKPGDTLDKGAVGKEDSATVDLPESDVDAPDAQQAAKRAE